MKHNSDKKQPCSLCSLRPVEPQAVRVQCGPATLEVFHAEFTTDVRVYCASESSNAETELVNMRIRTCTRCTACTQTHILQIAHTPKI